MPMSEKLQYNSGERENLYSLSFKWKGLCTFEASKDTIVGM